MEGKISANFLKAASDSGGCSLTAAFRKFAEFFLPSGNFDDAANTFGKMTVQGGRNLQSRRLEIPTMPEPQVGRVNLELFGDLVELDFWETR